MNYHRRWYHLGHMPIRPLAWWARSGGLRGGVARSGAAEGGAAWGGVGRRGGASGGWPLVVLVDEQSASAAEVFAGALRASGEAVIVGTRTFGKGASQALTYMSDGSALRFTVYTCLSWSQPNLLPQLEPNQTLASAGINPQVAYPMALPARPFQRQASKSKPYGSPTVTPLLWLPYFGSPTVASLLWLPYFGFPTLASLL